MRSKTGCSSIISIKRNTASHYLNQLNEEGILVKINTRPVYFFHKEAFQQQNYLLKRTVYQSFQEMIDEQPVFDRKSDFFQSVIGYRQVVLLKDKTDNIRMLKNFYPYHFHL